MQMYGRVKMDKKQVVVEQYMEYTIYQVVLGKEQHHM